MSAAKSNQPGLGEDVSHSGDTRILDGVRVIEADRGWILVLPDPSEAVTHLWAEGSDVDTAQSLLDEWAAVVERAGR